MPNFVTIVGFQGGGGTVSDSVQTSPKQTNGAPSSYEIRTSAAGVNVGQGQKVFIQNLATTALGVKLGSDASTTSVNLVLKAGTSTDDGNGGSVVIDDYIGVVSTVAMTGSARYVMWTFGS